MDLLLSQRAMEDGITGMQIVALPNIGDKLARVARSNSRHLDRVVMPHHLRQEP